MNKLRFSDVTNAMKFFIEFGGIEKVKDDGTVVVAESNEPIKVIYGEKTYPVKILSQNLPDSDDYRVLNLFKESGISENKEFEFFKTTRSIYPGYFMKRILVEIFSKKTDLNILGKLKKKVDKEMPNEIEELPAKVFGVINYLKKKHVAVFEVPIIRDKNKYKIREKTQELVEHVYKTIFGTLDFKNTFKYETTFIEMPWFHSCMSVLVQVFEKMKHVIEALFDVKLDIKTFKKHLDNLPEYEKLSRWYAPATPTPTIESEVKIESPNSIKVESTEKSESVKIDNSIPPWERYKYQKVKIEDDNEKSKYVPVVSIPQQHITGAISPVSTISNTPVAPTSPFMNNTSTIINPFTNTIQQTNMVDYNGFQTIQPNLTWGYNNPFL